MTERIDELTYSEPLSSATRTLLESNLFLTNPVEFLVTTFVEELKKDPAWSRLFADAIVDYEQMDISLRALPFMRCYFDRYRKDGETWYVNGDMIIDIIWPASIRRGELNRLPATIAGAMMQQLRRPNFFETLCEKIPGLNEFGKTVSANFDLGFKWQDDIVPLTRITANFRILLDEWDQYMTNDYRTKDDPFNRTLADLRRIVTQIDGLRGTDPEDVEIEIGIDQNVT